MGNKTKRILSVVAAATLLGATVGMSACGKDNYTGKALAGYTSEGEVTSNGGFAVQKGDYVYFINGVENYTASNEYGEVVKGALLRAKLADFESGKYDNIETVVPMLFVSQSYTSGIFVYGDYVYYATPTTDKDIKTGEIASDHIDFKRAKLDGSETMKDYYFRLSSNSTDYRFVEVGGVVYCMYTENGTLKSYNTATGATTVLVSGSSITYYFDKKDLTNPNVYYTMGVTYNVDTDMSSTASYNQIYCANAASTATVNAGEASYTVKTYNETTKKFEVYKTYDFDKGYLEGKNEEAEATAKKNNTDPTGLYEFDDYTTYPYVNLGTLVLDGVGSACEKEQYNNESEKDTTPEELQGYTYTITRNENGGVYYTRKAVAPDNNLYFLAGKPENTVSANAKDNVDIVAKDTTNASDTALFVSSENGKHVYLYVSGSKIVRATRENGETTEQTIYNKASSPKLWKVEGNDLYYYQTGTNTVTGASTSGNNLVRIDYTGDAENYHLIQGTVADAKYKPAVVKYVDMNNSWYAPETFGSILLYSNAQSNADVPYNYIYATKLGTAEEIEANNEKYFDAYEYIESFEDNSDLKALMTYYFRTGSTAAYESVKDLYDAEKQADKYIIDEFNTFIAATSENGTEVNGETVKLNKESDFIHLISKMTDADIEAINASWAETLRVEEEEEIESGMDTWQICLIIAASVIVVATAVAVPVIMLSKKKAQREAAERTVNAYKRKKIDTTDDKSIDVYATEEPAETTEEAPAEEAPAEEAVEETVEKTVEETVEEAPAEETAPVETPVEAPAEEVAPAPAPAEEKTEEKVEEPTVSEENTTNE